MELLGSGCAAVGTGDVVRRAPDQFVDHDHNRVRFAPVEWSVAPPASRDAAARALGVDHVLLECEAHYVLERAVFAWWRAELAWMPTRTHAAVNASSAVVGASGARRGVQAGRVTDGEPVPGPGCRRNHPSGTPPRTGLPGRLGFGVRLTCAAAGGGSCRAADYTCLQC